jgi:hypothetical protein
MKLAINDAHMKKIKFAYNVNVKFMYPIVGIYMKVYK